MVSLYDEATETVTPLQAKVLAATPEDPAPVYEIADAARLRAVRATGRGTAPDSITTRNVLLFLRAKGLVAFVPPDRWRRL